ncbi:hypothetical protein KI387_003320, partial [Taxus chinensis]
MEEVPESIPNELPTSYEEFMLVVWKEFDEATIPFTMDSIGRLIKLQTDIEGYGSGLEKVKANAAALFRGLLQFRTERDAIVKTNGKILNYMFDKDPWRSTDLARSLRRLDNIPKSPHFPLQVGDVLEFGGHPGDVPCELVVVRWWGYVSQTSPSPGDVPVPKTSVLGVPVLQSVNLSIGSGELVALVGLSGSGKSTLVNLLLRLYEPESGQILVDGIPLNELDIMWLRSKIGVVSQEPRLFSMDIASNISYGCTGKVNHSDIEWAAKQAHAHEFIVSLPDGYKTLVDNARLSGGQKQRISIARAVLRKPTILVLDEATSALDAESENYVKKAIERIMQSNGKRKSTLLVIAHRLSTIRAADRIVVMENGRIIE